MSDPLPSHPETNASTEFSASADFYRRLVEEGADVLVLVDRSGSLLWANESAARTLARSREACLGLGFVQSAHPEDRERTQKALLRWFEAELDRPVPFENRIVNAEGRVFALRWNIRRHRSEQGELLICNGHDITPQKRYERALLESEARHRALLSGVLDPLIIIDAVGLIQSVSDSVLPTFGYEPAELVGQNVRVLMPSPHFEKHDQYLANYAATGETHILNDTREFQVVRKDGALIDCELSVSRVDIPGQGEPLFIGSLRDVTKRRQVERALLQRETVFRAIFDQEFQFVGLCSPDGTLLEVNRTALEAVGATREQVLGEPFWETPWWEFSEETRDQLRDGVRRAACGEFVRFQYQFINAEGSIRTIDFSLKPVFDDRGNVSMLIPEGRDVTDLEEARRAETQMYKALAEIGESAAVLAHEVKNPITAVNLALRAVADQLGEDSKAVLEDLVSRMQTLERTLRSTLTFAKPVQLERRSVGSTELLNQVLAKLRVEFVRVGVIVDLRRDFEDLTLEVDVGKLSEVFDNLLRNAMQATGSGGRILIGCAQRRPGWARFTVEDDGHGLPDNLRANLFKPFVSSRSGGTGLGLPICRRIIEEHGGSIDATDSELGGACFKVRLPMPETGDKQ
jgi:PAS domain S-box-containing protein